MARPCSICRHPDAHNIDIALVGGASIRCVARQFSVSADALGRHLRRHIRDRIAAAVPETPTTITVIPPDPHIAEIVRLLATHRDRELTEGASLRQHIVADVQRLESLYATAKAIGDMRGMSDALRTKYFILSRVGLLDRIDDRMNDEKQEDPAEAQAKELVAMIREVFDFNVKLP